MHTKHILLGLVSFTLHAFEIDPVVFVSSSLFLLMGSIPLYECTKICLSILLVMNIDWVLHVLTVINEATVNIPIQVFL